MNWYWNMLKLWARHLWMTRKLKKAQWRTLAGWMSFLIAIRKGRYRIKLSYAEIKHRIGSITTHVPEAHAALDKLMAEAEAEGRTYYVDRYGKIKQHATTK